MDERDQHTGSEERTGRVRRIKEYRPVDIEKVVQNIQRVCREKGTTPTAVGKESGAAVCWRAGHGSGIWSGGSAA